jgi:hypothetical protein
MKRYFLTLIFCLVLIAFASPTFANPFLACDPMTAEVTQIDVELNGQLIHVPDASIVKRADAWLLVDLSTIGGGSYTAKAMALYGEWGQSDWSADFLFVKPVIDAPANTRLETQ